MVYELKVGMTCGGCSGAIERILGNNPGKWIIKELYKNAALPLYSYDLDYL